MFPKVEVVGEKRFN